ncbi:MAG: hypothetical protein DRH97_00130 [Chloroflexi bacterium]|nr:MAG: hypothetical protein DRH97_00130 [Chloroflexota bacterium]
MPLDTPTIEELSDRGRADFKTVNPLSNPYDPAGLPNALIVSDSNRVRELYDSLEIVVRDTFTATAEEQALLNKGLEYGLTPNSPIQAQGNVIFVGIAGTDVPINTPIQGQNGETYNSELTKTISENTIAIPTLTSSGVTATAVFNTAHGLGSGMTITFADTVEIEYNGDFVITVISETQLQYTLLSSTTSPATGLPTATYTGVVVSAISETATASANLAGGSILSLSQSIAGVESNVYTQFSGMDGGADVESEDSFRERIELFQQNPQTNFDKTSIELEARKVSGVTRVWVIGANEVNTSQVATTITSINGFKNITFPEDHDLFSGMLIQPSGANEAEYNGDFECLVVDSDNVAYYNPGSNGTATGSITVDYSNIQPGQVRVFFVRDNDATIIPSAQEIQDVKDQILTIKPAHTSDADVIVDGPTLKSVDFVFTTLVPDTSGLRTSIAQNLEDLFFTTEPGATITQDAYRTAIQNSFDIETKQGVNQFVLSTPTGSIESLYNEIIALGDITYSL